MWHMRAYSLTQYYNPVGVSLLRCCFGPVFIFVTLYSEPEGARDDVTDTPRLSLAATSWRSSGVQVPFSLVYMSATRRITIRLILLMTTRTFSFIGPRRPVTRAQPPQQESLCGARPCSSSQC
jgi:hypothetical protein